MSDGQVWRERRFSASEAAFTGFRLIAREPLAALAWASVMLVVGLVFGALAVVAIGPVMMQAMSAGPNPDPTAQLALVSRLLPFYGLVLPLSLAFYALFYGVVNRAVLRPEQRRTAYLRFGADELKQLAVLALYGLVLFGVYLALGLAMIVLGVLGGLSAAATPGSSPGTIILLFALLGLASFAALLFIGVRLSLCTALTFDTGRVDLFGSWRMTKGRFWPLLGAYLLAWLVGVLLWIVLAVVFGAVAMAVGGGIGAASVIFRPNMSSLATYFAPAQVIWLLLSAGASAMWIVVLIGVSAGAYAQIRELERPAPAPTTGF